MKNSQREGLLLALDFGGTKLAAATAVLGENQLLDQTQAAAPQDSNAGTDMDIVARLAHGLLEMAKLPLVAVGVSFGGPVDAGQGLVRLSHHTQGWENVPLREMLEDRHGVPVAVDNDANVAALGEFRFGAGQGCGSLMYITVSTGVGGGWILDGKPWRGEGGMAGEIGHVVVDPQGPVCPCGKRGCVERLASGPFIAQRAREWLQTEPRRGSILRQLAIDEAESTREHELALDQRLAGGYEITAEMVSRAADLGDDLAWQALEVSARALGRAIGNAANLVDPRRFVLGGGVTKAGERWWATVRRVARETALPEVELEIIPAALGDDAPLWGAMALAQDLGPPPQRQE
jgi:glucokinase